MAEQANNLLKNAKKYEIPKEVRINMRNTLKQLFQLTGPDDENRTSRRHLFEIEKQLENFLKNPPAPNSKIQKPDAILTIKIRNFFRLRPYTTDISTLPRALNLIDRQAENILARSERFIEFASRKTQTAQQEPVNGYREPLLENLPDKNLVLHPPKKRR